MIRRFGFIAVIVSAMLQVAAGLDQEQDVGQGLTPAMQTEPAAPGPEASLRSDPPPRGTSEPTSQSAEPTTQASQPTTRAVESEDPLRSPATMVEEFLLAMGESEKKPDRMKDALRCLDLSAMEREDSGEDEQLGPRLAEQLEQIIDTLLNTYGKSRDEIPEEPDAEIVRFPKQSDVRLVIARSDDGLWRFSAQTVSSIPELLEAVKAKEGETEAPNAEGAADVPAGFRSARATMLTFLEAMKTNDLSTAANCLDLSEKPAITRAEIGADLAVKLQHVMDRYKVFVPQDLPDKPDAEPQSWYSSEDGRIELERQEGPPQNGYWLFTKATVNSIEPLYKAFQGKARLSALDSLSFWKNPQSWLLEKVPPSLKGETFGVETWQWLGFGILLVLGYAVHRAALLIFCALARPLSRTQQVALLPTRIAAQFRPLAMLVMVATWWWGLRLFLIPQDVQAYVWPALKFVMTVVGVWVSYRLIDLASEFFAARAARTISRLDDVLVPLLRKTLKILVIPIGIIFILRAVGVSEDSLNKLFAGLGIGGLAFALAAKDTLANFFGSLTVVFDRPFQVGDWIKMGNVEGTVESVGLRSSRIRTFYNSQITIPNSELTTTTVDNMGRRRYRRISCKLSVTYSTTPEQLDAFCEGIRELIRRHPFTRKDYYLVWVTEFAASSINVMLYCFHETPDWTTEMRERHRLFLDIIRLANRLGVEFAFPTQTIHLAKENGDIAGATPSKTDMGATASMSASAVLPTRDRGGARSAVLTKQGRAVRKADAASPAEKTAEEAMALGRAAAVAIAKETIGSVEDIPPKFEFPKVR
ncbi:MAG: mechanosensitive ion channel [Phycisphaerae bacterium]|nr:mechanosensitive ion channel [Phycisphaerae bacterium]